MFDGLDNRDMRTVVSQSVVFLPLVLASLAMAVRDTYSKMSLQRGWRAWLNGHVLDRWLTSGRYYQLTLRPGEHSTPESRVAEDLRLSVDAPVDIVLGIFAALITAHHLYRRAVVHRRRDHHSDRNHDAAHPGVPGDHRFPLRGAGQRRHGENRRGFVAAG